jgi:hypothetical protein
MSTLDDILLAAKGKVDAQKLSKLRKKLEAATNARLDNLEIIDPTRIRLQLAAHLRSEGASRGIVHSYEQLFMGIVRRAALQGLVETPAEGPWSIKWQKLLDRISTQDGIKSCARGLAGWATAKGFEPDSISEEALQQWSHVFFKDPQVDIVQLIRASLASDANAKSHSSNSRLQRLALKASIGSVRDLSETYGVRRRPPSRTTSK